MFPEHFLLKIPCHLPQNFQHPAQLYPLYRAIYSKDMLTSPSQLTIIKLYEFIRSID